MINTISKNPMERRQGRKFQFKMWEETPQNYLRENTRSQVATSNPIHIVHPVGFETGVLEVKDEERYHYANLTLPSILFINKK